MVNPRDIAGERKKKKKKKKMLCNDCFRSVYAYFLCKLVCTCIHHVHDAFVFVCLWGGGHLYCSAHLSMFNMEKHYRNKIIIITDFSFNVSLIWCHSAGTD